MVGGSGPYGVRYVVGYDAGASWHYEDVPECGGDGSFWAVTPDEDTVFAVTGSPTGPATQDRPGYYQRGLRELLDSEAAGRLTSCTWAEWAGLWKGETTNDSHPQEPGGGREVCLLILPR